MDMLKLFPSAINAKIDELKPDKAKVEEVCKAALDDAVLSQIARGPGGLLESDVKKTVMLLQAVWNEKESWKDECLRLRARPGENAPGSGA